MACWWNTPSLSGFFCCWWSKFGIFQYTLWQLFAVLSLLGILSLDWNCYDRQTRAARAQSFALRQQATIEITRRDYSLRTLIVMFNRSQASISRDSTPRSLYYCLFAPHVYGVVLCPHSVCGEPLFSAMAAERLQQNFWPFSRIF